MKGKHMNQAVFEFRVSVEATDPTDPNLWEKSPCYDNRILLKAYNGIWIHRSSLSDYRVHNGFELVATNAKTLATAQKLAYERYLRYKESEIDAWDAIK
jgi:hypothetical protein